MKRGANFRGFLINLCYTCVGESVNYRTRGGEWRGGIAATPHNYMESVVRKGINEWRNTEHRSVTARKLISYKFDSKLPDDQSLPSFQINKME